jgi:hypothetical protein
VQLATHRFESSHRSHVWVWLLDARTGERELVAIVGDMFTALLLLPGRASAHVCLGEKGGGVELGWPE